MPHTKSKNALRSEFGRLLLVPEIYPYRHDVVTPEDKNPCLGCAFQNPDDEAADGELCLKPKPVDDTCMERRIIYIPRSLEAVRDYKVLHMVERLK